MEHKSDQPHRWDLECIEAGSAQHNKEAQKELTKYLKHNPTAVATRDKQRLEFKQLMERVIENLETCEGVPES